MNLFLRKIVMLSILRLLVEMLLPEGAMHKICDLTLGLILMHAMLQALKKLLNGGIIL